MIKTEKYYILKNHLITINTPVRDDYQLSDKAKSRVEHINVYDPRDPVQIGGGNYIDIGSGKKLSGEFGPAGRRFNNAKNIKVDNPQGIFSDKHNSHNRVNDWKDKVVPSTVKKND